MQLPSDEMEGELNGSALATSSPADVAVPEIRAYPPSRGADSAGKSSAVACM